MDSLPQSRLFLFVERARVLAHRAVPRFSRRCSRKKFSLRQRVVLLCLKVKKTTRYRDLVDELIEMPCIWDPFDLDLIPAPLGYSVKRSPLGDGHLTYVVERRLGDLPVNGVTSIDASEFKRANASIHCTKGVNLTIQQLKTTLLINTATNTVPDIHVMTTRKYDTQITPKVVKRNTASMTVLTADKGYDDQKLRRLARDFDVHQALWIHTSSQGVECTALQRPSPCWM